LRPCSEGPGPGSCRDAPPRAPRSSSSPGYTAPLRDQVLKLSSTMQPRACSLGAHRCHRYHCCCCRLHRCRCRRHRC
jgi:hypothetical protein